MGAALKIPTEREKLSWLEESWTFLVRTGRKSWTQEKLGMPAGCKVWRGPPTHSLFNTLIQYFGASDPGSAG